MMPPRSVSLSRYLHRYPKLLLLALLGALLFVVGQVGGMLQAGQFFVTVFIGQAFQHVQWWTYTLLFGVGLAWTASMYISQLSGSLLAACISHDIRADLYDKLVHQPVSKHLERHSGDTMARVLGDLQIIELFLAQVLLDLFAQPLLILTVVVVMITINWKLTLFFFTLGPVLGLLMSALGAFVHKHSQYSQEKLADMSSHIQEMLQGFRVIKGFSVEDWMNQRFQRTNDSHLEHHSKELRMRLAGMPLSNLLGILAMLGVGMLGIQGLKSGVSTPAELLQFILLILVLAYPVSVAGNIFMVLQKLKPATQRVFSILDEPAQASRALPLEVDQGGFHINQVSFRYPYTDPFVLSDVSFDIPAGQSLAILGPSGSGKSSLLALLLGFESPSQGHITLDGQDMTQRSLQSYRKQCALVTQSTQLFSGSVRDNLLLANPQAAPQELLLAAEQAHAREFIEALPQGFDTPIGENGATLSGGQAQRLALARAVLRQPKVLFLDEPTSALDAQSADSLNGSIIAFMQRQTSILVTHDTRLAKHADHILFLEHAQIRESGTHESLLKQQGAYAHFYKLQGDAS